ncbi:hypothetical protein MMPV_001637 [Pyropia vietnamensis]
MGAATSCLARPPSGSVTKRYHPSGRPPHGAGGRAGGGGGSPITAASDGVSGGTRGGVTPPASDVTATTDARSSDGGGRSSADFVDLPPHMSVDHVLRPRDAGAVLDTFSMTAVGPAAAARLYAGTPLGGGWQGGLGTPHRPGDDDDDARSRTSTEATPELPSDLDDGEDGAEGGRPFSCDTAALLLNLRRDDDDDGHSDADEPPPPGAGGGGAASARAVSGASPHSPPPTAAVNASRATPWTPPPALPMGELSAASGGDANVGGGGGSSNGGGGLSPHGSPLIGVIRERVDCFERLGRERHSLQAAMGSPGRAALAAPQGKLGGRSPPSSPTWLGPAALSPRRSAGPAEGGRQ